MDNMDDAEEFLATNVSGASEHAWWRIQWTELLQELLAGDSSSDMITSCIQQSYTFARKILTKLYMFGVAYRMLRALLLRLFESI